MSVRPRTPLPMLVLLSSFVCSPCTAQSEVLDGWTIKAGRVKVERPARQNEALAISGVFTLKKVDSNTDSRRAGACLLADLTDQMVGKQSCTAQEECMSVEHRLAPAGALEGSVDTTELLFEGKAYGYCASPDEDKEPKRCWTRPGPDSEYCTKGQFEPGTYKVPDTASAQADPLRSGKPVRWMVYGCLNSAAGAIPPPCSVPAATDKVYSVGPAKLVHPLGY